jgi:hypothetical protein
MKTTTPPPTTTLDLPVRTLLPTDQTTDFNRNFRTLEKSAKRPYSLATVIRESGPGGKLSGFEAEVSEELRSLAGKRALNGPLVPLSVLSRDLAASPGLGQELIQTWVSRDQPIPFLRYKSVTGRLGATLLTDLPGGPWKFPRATGTAGASWLGETATATPTNMTFDQVLLQPSRITGNTNISTVLVKTSAPSIEQAVIADLSAAIATEVDRVVLNGSGTGAEPLGILNLPINAAGTYAYDKRSPDVTFGGPASWASVLTFEDELDGHAQVHNDGSYGWAGAPDVRTKWMDVPKIAGYPEFLWSQPDTEIDGRVAGRKAVSSSQLPPGKIIFARWSDALIASWLGIEIQTDPYSLASQGEIVVRANMLVAIAFRYSSAFISSSDSASA